MSGRVGKPTGLSQAEPCSTVSTLTGFDPSRRDCEETLRQINDLLDPLQGVERGIMEDDPGSLLLNIRVGELRKIALCLIRCRRAVASAIEARSDATGTGAAEGESAGPKDDAHA
jgi:hypothetical protein